MRLVVYTDYVYRESEGVIYGERAFALFVAALADHVEELTIVGRLDPGTGPSHYPLPGRLGFVALPHYASLTRPIGVLISLGRSLHRFWRVLDDADCAWVLGPYPHAVAFAVIGMLRRRRVVLGVRQDFPVYVRSRRPSRRWMHRAADVLEWSWRTLARRCPVVVVGPELASHYRHAPQLLPIAVSLISVADIEAGEQAAERRSYESSELRVLSVGRLDDEKNPLLLADVLARLREHNPRWRLTVCGEGPLSEALAARLRLPRRSKIRRAAGLCADFRWAARPLSLLSRVSPRIVDRRDAQVLLEAFASGVPVVATAVGGVAAAVGEAALLIPPGDAIAAANSVARLASDPASRGRLVAAGIAQASRQTLEQETRRVAEFIRG